nr:MAG TPA: hypothetical protein [Caudoviricetes sp.]
MAAKKTTTENVVTPEEMPVMTEEMAEEMPDIDKTGKEDATMKAFEEKLSAMLAASEAKANEIIATAETRAKEIISAAEKNVKSPEDIDAVNKKINDELEEYTMVRLFKDSDKYKDDVFLCVNGENCVVKRGVPVKIKKKFALILEQSYQQDLLTAELMAEKEKEFNEAVKNNAL